MEKDQNIELLHADPLANAVLELQRNMILVMDRLNLLENGLYSERKRNSSILKRIRKLKEEPEIQEILEALQPESKNLVQKQENWLMNLKPGDPIPSELFYSEIDKDKETK